MVVQGEGKCKMKGKRKNEKGRGRENNVKRKKIVRKMPVLRGLNNL